MSMPKTTEQRLVDLELIVTHLQHDMEQLNGALIDQQKQLEALRRLFDRLSVRIDGLEAGDEERDPQSERPPHY